jgi:hypothetical protein
MFRITIEDMDGGADKKVMFIGSQYAVFGDDPNRKEMALSNISASVEFMLSTMEVMNKVIKQKTALPDDVEIKDVCTIDLTNPPEELRKDVLDLLEHLKAAGIENGLVDMRNTTPEIREKIARLAVKTRQSPIDKLADMIKGKRNKGIFN